MLVDLLTQTITIQHIDEAGAVDDYGAPVRSVTDSVDVLGLLEPLTETEQLVEAETYKTTWRLFLEPDVEIEADDLVVVNGKIFEIDEVLPFFNPRVGAAHHIECKVTEIEG